MIPLPIEPGDFDARVRQPGLAFLRSRNQDPNEPPQGANQLWGRNGYDGKSWQPARDQLREWYGNRCVYSCFVLEQERKENGSLQSTHSIDHFWPKSSSPAYLAYEWHNLRWAWNVIDNHKQDKIINHDPTSLTHNIMELEEDNDGDWIVVPAASLPDLERTKIDKTIKDLGLNNDVVKIIRKQWAEDFLDEDNPYDHAFMDKRQPFVYRELRRSGRL